MKKIKVGFVGASRENILSYISEEGKKRFWDNWSREFTHCSNVA